MIKINIDAVELYKGCILAAIAHAVMVGKYPELNYEHSWDGINYCMNNSEGCRGIITFHPKYVVAVFQDLSKLDECKVADDYFSEADDEILEIAKSEALQYVLEEIDGEVKPVITAAFWGTWEQLFSDQTLEDITENGGYIIENQLLPYNEALQQWEDYYEIDDKQKNLIYSLYEQGIKGRAGQILLEEDELEALYGDLDECKQSLGELGIRIKE